MKVNVIKAKDKYAQSCGSLDWYDHIKGMSSIDVEIEMEYVCEQVTSEMLEMLKDSVEVIKWYMENSTTELHELFFNIGANQIEQTEQLIRKATEDQK